MKKTVFPALALAAAYCLVLFVQGCGHTCGPNCGHDHGRLAIGTAAIHDGCDSDHTPRHNNVVAVFPGHTYAMEIIDDRTTGLVTAFLTCVHFDPVAVDATEVRLNFLIDSTPRQFILIRTEQTEGEPATFTLTDMELAVLICEGWQGDATTRIEIGGVPFSARMVKVGACGHVH